MFSVQIETSFDDQQKHFHAHPVHFSLFKKYGFLLFSYENISFLYFSHLKITDSTSCLSYHNY